jgi:hypothetical protein
MHYINEQITNTFEHLLELRQKYASSVSPIKSRTFYRINQAKLEKYRSQYNVKYDIEHLLSNNDKQLFIKESKESHLAPIVKHFPGKIIEQKVIEIDGNEEDIEQTNTLSSHSERTESVGNNNSNISNSLSSVSSSSTNPRYDSDNAISSELSLKTHSNETQEYELTSQPRSSHCRVYIRSIGRYMLGDDISNSFSIE